MPTPVKFSLYTIVVQKFCHTRGAEIISRVFICFFPSAIIWYSASKIRTGMRAKNTNASISIVTVFKTHQQLSHKGRITGDIELLRYGRHRYICKLILCIGRKRTQQAVEDGVRNRLGDRV